MITLSNHGALAYQILNLDFLEYGGKDKNKPDELIKYIKENYSIICFFSPEVCEMNINFNTVKTLEASPSVNLDRSDRDRLPIYFKIEGGTSTKNLVHMGQLIHDKRFASFSYPTSQGKDIPLDQNKIPTVLFTARDDKIGDVADNKQLAETLSNVVKLRILDDEDHLSVIFSKNMTYFEEVLQIMNNY